MLFAAQFRNRSFERLEHGLTERVVAGGCPAALLRAKTKRRAAWYRDYIETLVQRDARDLARIRALGSLPRLLQLAAGQTARLVNVAEMASAFQLSRPTIRDYVVLLERIFLLEHLQPWHSNRLRRLIKTPKLHLGDTGLASALLGVDAEFLIKDRAMLDQLLETFVFQELKRQASWSDTPVQFSHFRDKEVIFSLAKDIPTCQRADFLDKIKTSLPDSGSIKIRKIAPIEKILEDIETLKEDIEERIEAIEDGSYWDDPESWDNEYDYDENPDLISEDQIDELSSFFGEAENLFLDDRLDDARKVYQALFGLIEAFREPADVSLADAVDIREARARYCRCVYETVKESEKLHAFAGAMDIDWIGRYEANRREYNEDYPLLQDVIDASVGEMKHLDTFLPAWRKTLEKKWTKVRTAVLLLEAVHHLEGLVGVSRLARMWKNKQPAGYLYWLDILKRQAELENIIAVSVEGLKVLRQGRSRERVARFLIDAAAEAGDPAKLLEGKRGCFFSQPE